MKKYVMTFILVCTGCNQNLFDEITDKDTDVARFFQAKQEINKKNFTEAIDLMDQLEPDFLNDRERLSVYASAYAGRCGLDFLGLFTSVREGVRGSLLGVLMGAFKESSKRGIGGHEDCTKAVQILEGLGDENLRDGNENLLIAFISFARIGSILDAFADEDNDGAVDTDFNQCVNDEENLPEAQVREIGASFATALLSLGALGTNYATGATDSIESLCNTGGAISLSTLCTKTDPAAFTPEEVRALRYMIGSRDLGIGSCGENDFISCAVLHETPGGPSCQ